METIKGFSKLSKVEKIDLIASKFFPTDSEVPETLRSYWHSDKVQQQVFDEFSENTLTNFYAPYGVVPNLKLNDKLYCVPMVIEESSVVAACAKSAKFWTERGGVKSEVISTNKVGQVHFLWEGNDFQKLEKLFSEKKAELMDSVRPLEVNMRKRGGGLLDLSLVDKSQEMDKLFQIHGSFETCDAMGANFINTILEHLGKTFKEMVMESPDLDGKEREVQVVMAILSNYTPECRVRVWVECPVADLANKDHGMGPLEFAQKIKSAAQIAYIDPYRAVTHNKGIFNGIDAVVLATGNDFRAVEACGHAYAAKDGQYRGLTIVEITEEGIFRFELNIPLALGTVGGLTSLHPLAKFSLDLLGRPSASELMEIAASVGLLQNFGALRSLVTSGIQKGHMKMHLLNILKQLGATEDKIVEAKEYFSHNVVSFQAVRDFISSNRTLQ